MAGKSNYITNMQKQYGDNWIVATRPEDIQRSGKRIFKEMVLGKFDYEASGKYFLDAKFLENLIIAASNELEINSLYSTAVKFYMQYNPQVPNISVHQNHLDILCFVYNTIHQKLLLVKNTGNIGYLHDLSACLFSYRNHLG